MGMSGRTAWYVGLRHVPGCPEKDPSGDMVRSRVRRRPVRVWSVSRRTFAAGPRRRSVTTRAWCRSEARLSTGVPRLADGALASKVGGEGVGSPTTRMGRRTSGVMPIWLAGRFVEAVQVGERLPCRIASARRSTGFARTRGRSRGPAGSRRRRGVVHGDARLARNGSEAGARSVARGARRAPARPPRPRHTRAEFGVAFARLSSRSCSAATFSLRAWICSSAGRLALASGACARSHGGDRDDHPETAITRGRDLTRPTRGLVAVGVVCDPLGALAAVALARRRHL